MSIDFIVLSTVDYKELQSHKKTKKNPVMTFNYRIAYDYLAQSALHTSSCSVFSVMMSLFPAVSEQFLIFSCCSKNQSQVSMSTVGFFLDHLVKTDRSVHLCIKIICLCRR